MPYLVALLAYGRARTWHRADSRFLSSLWEMALLCNNVSHCLGASLESALLAYRTRGTHIQRDQNQWFGLFFCIVFRIRVRVCIPYIHCSYIETRTTWQAFFLFFSWVTILGLYYTSRFVCSDEVDDKLVLVLTMNWGRAGLMPLPELMMID